MQHKVSGRRIAVFLDGTANTPEELEGVSKRDFLTPPPITNVVRLLRGVITDERATTKSQVLGYFPGVGTTGSFVTQLRDQATGRGVSDILLDAYRFIAHNLEWRSETDPTSANRDEVYIFGFSRGAYIARALTGFLNFVGLLKKKSLWMLPNFFDAYQDVLFQGRKFDPRVADILAGNVHANYRSVPVHFLGVWDTVGALAFNDKADDERFHNTALTPNVTSAFQALAIHELRSPFKPVFWTDRAKKEQVVEQVWFAGAHSNIGGGYSDVGLSQFALDWMAYKATAYGLELDRDYLKGEIEGARNVQEMIKYSRNRAHKADGSTLYSRLERPIGRLEMDRYYAEQFDQYLGAAPLLDEMKTHWSVQERLGFGPAYLSDEKAFRRLDKKFNGILPIDRKESLFPYP